MPDQNDFLGGHKIFRDLFIERRLLRNTFALIVRFFTVNQAAMKSMRIVRLDVIFACRPASTKVLVDPRAMMVDDHNHASGLNWLAWGFVLIGFA